MNKMVTLQHVVRRHGNQMVFFYDGALEAKDGILAIPLDRPEWVERAWRSGYRQNPANSETLNTLAEVFEMAEKQSGKTADSTESAEETSVEDSHAGRQSETGNGVRAAKPSSGTSAKSGRASGPSGRSANNGKAQAKG